MQTQLIKYFTSHNFLASQQYGFRSNRSTELAALELMDRNVNCMNQNSCPINIYIDLSKAFDSLKYDIFRSKLHYYGLQNNALRLLKSYLHDYFFSTFLLMTFLRQLQKLKLLCMLMIQLWCHTLKILVH